MNFSMVVYSLLLLITSQRSNKNSFVFIIVCFKGLIEIIGLISPITMFFHKFSEQRNFQILTYPVFLNIDINTEPIKGKFVVRLHVMITFQPHLIRTITMLNVFAKNSVRVVI